MTPLALPILKFKGVVALNSLVEPGEFRASNTVFLPSFLICTQTSSLNSIFTVTSPAIGCGGVVGGAFGSVVVGVPATGGVPAGNAAGSVGAGVVALTAVVAAAGVAVVLAGVVDAAVVVVEAADAVSVVVAIGVVAVLSVLAGLVSAASGSVLTGLLSAATG